MGYGIRDTGYGIRDTGYGIRDNGITGYGIRDTGYGIRDTGLVEPHPQPFPLQCTPTGSATSPPRQHKHLARKERLVSHNHLARKGKGAGA